jgi:hypothetical protein
MFTRSWIRRVFARPSSHVRRRTRRLAFDWLEDRVTPNTYTLSNVLDDGSTGCLRWAINQANSNPGPNTIVFPANLNTGLVFGVPLNFPAVINLSSPLPTITNDLTINGDPIGDTVSGANSFGIMSIAADVNVTINTLTLANGGSLSQSQDGAPSQGGAIDNQGLLTITNCAFSNNAADDGGAIYNEVGSQLTISGSTFLGCQVPNPTTPPTLAASAAGNFTGGTLYTYEYTWVTPAGESAASPSSAMVQPQFGQQVTVTIPALPAGVTKANVYRAPLQGQYALVGSTSTTTFADLGNAAIGSPPPNQSTVLPAATTGGAIANLGTLHVSTSTFTGFLATGSGAAIDNTGSANISGCTLTTNEAPTGGAVANTNGFLEASLTITNSTFSNNDALGGAGSTLVQLGVGGAIWVASGIVALDQVTLSGIPPWAARAARGRPGQRARAARWPSGAVP